MLYAHALALYGDLPPSLGLVGNEMELDLYSLLGGGDADWIRDTFDRTEPPVATRYLTEEHNRFPRLEPPRLDAPRRVYRFISGRPVEELADVLAAAGVERVDLAWDGAVRDEAARLSVWADGRRQKVTFRSPDREEIVLDGAAPDMWLAAVTPLEGTAWESIVSGPYVLCDLLPWPGSYGWELAPQEAAAILADRPGWTRPVLGQDGACTEAEAVAMAEHLGLQVQGFLHHAGGALAPMMSRLSGAVEAPEGSDTAVVLEATLSGLGARVTWSENGGVLTADWS